MSNITKIKEGDSVVLMTTDEVNENLTVDINSDDEFTFENVDVAIEQLDAIHKDVPYIVSFVDDEGDFKLAGNYYTFANELIKSVNKA